MSAPTLTGSTGGVPGTSRHGYRSRHVPVSPVTQGRMIASEWVKLSTLRSTWITLTVAFVGTVGFSALGCWAVVDRLGRADQARREAFSAINQSVAGAQIAMLAIVVLGVLAITGEYATGMIRSTVSACPKRLPLLWGKLLVFGVMAWVVSTLASFTSFFIGQRILGSYGTTISAPGALRAVFGVGLYLTVVGLLSLGLGTLIRSTAGSIAAVFGLLLILPPLALLLPTNWQDHIVRYLPSNAGSALFSVPADPGLLAPWTGFAVLCAWAAVAIALGAVRLKRSDT